MNENRAAAPGNPRTDIVIDFDEEIIERIIPPQPVAGFLGRSSKWTIVPAVPHIFAPGEIRGNRSRREWAARPGVAVPAPPQAHEPVTTPGRGAVPLEFVGADTPAAQGHRHGQRPGQKDAFAPSARAKPHANEIERAISHPGNQFFSGYEAG